MLSFIISFFAVKCSLKLLLVISSYRKLGSSEFVVALDPGLPLSGTPSYRNCRGMSRRRKEIFWL